MSAAARERSSSVDTSKYIFRALDAAKPRDKLALKPGKHLIAGAPPATPTLPRHRAVRYIRGFQ